jgi:hypothetical protein
VTSEWSINKREKLRIKPSTSGVRAIFTEEEGSPCSMNLVSSADKLAEERDRVSDVLCRKENVGATKEGISFVVGQTVTDISWWKAKRRTLDDLAPINVLLAFENQFTRPMAAIETTRHHRGKEKVIVPTSANHGIFPRNL